jgi:hypothetical protein
LNDIGGNISHEKYVAIQRRRAYVVARAVINGELGAVEGSRILTRLGYGLALGNIEPDFMLTFAGVDSETDDLPLGAERDLWNPQALDRKDAELQEYQPKVEEEVRQACSSLIDVLEHLGTQSTEDSL